jgi:hypothetical protein
MKLKHRNILFAISVGILSFTSSLKVWTLLTALDSLVVPDPLFTFLSGFQLIILVAILELIVVFILIVSRSTSIKLFSLAWLSTAFLAYRIGLYIIGHAENCSCAGGPETWLALGLGDSIELSMKLGLAYMLISSYYHIFTADSVPLMGCASVPQ